MEMWLIHQRVETILWISPAPDQGNYLLPRSLWSDSSFFIYSIKILPLLCSEHGTFLSHAGLVNGGLLPHIRQSRVEISQAGKLKTFSEKICVVNKSICPLPDWRKRFYRSKRKRNWVTEGVLESTTRLSRITL